MQSLDDRRGRSSPAIREEKRSSLLEGKQVINHNKRASVTFDRMVEIYQEGEKTPKSTSLVRSSSTNSFFGVQLEASKKKIPQKKSRVVRTKVF